MPPTCGAIILLVSIVLLSHPSSAIIGNSTELLSQSTSVQITPSDAWSCCNDSVSCAQPSPQGSSPSCAFDGNSATRWTLMPGQRNATITVDLNQGYIIDHFEVSFDPSSVIPSSIVVTLFGNNVTWTSSNNKSCQPSDRNLRKDGSLYYNCSPAGQFWSVSSPTGLFSTRNGSSNWLWWRSFTRLQLTIQAIDSDFNDQTQNESIAIDDIRLYGWKQPTTGCNCHPVGVVDANNPCSPNGTCMCREGSSTTDQCIPIIFDGPRMSERGLLSGGANLPLQGVYMQGVYLQNITSATVGNDYGCKLLKINNTLLQLQTVAANLSDAKTPLPIWLCWERITGAVSCLITSLSFIYTFPVVSSISPAASINRGGITQTVLGEDLDLSTFPHLVVIAYSTFSKATFNVYDYTNRPYTSDHLDDRHCTIVNSTTMTCVTMSLDTLSNDYMMVVGISFNSSSYGSYNACGNCQPFKLSKDPTIADRPWSSDPRPYPAYQGRTPVDIPGGGFTDPPDGFPDTVYRVEVSGIPCEIVRPVFTNTINFYPPDISSLVDYTKKQETVLYIGAYYSLTVGNLLYYKNVLDNPTNRNALIGGLVGGILGLMLLVGIILLIVYCRRRQRDKRRRLLDEEHQRYTRSPGQVDGPLTGYLSDDVKAQVDKYTVPYERIELVSELGKGNFGKVFKGTFKDTTGVKQTVAIKSLHGHSEVKDKVEFLQEAMLMADFCHKHVLSLIAIAIKENCPYVVLPLMEHGDLRNYMMKNNKSFTVGHLVGLSLQVAEGMEYLASRRFIHRDLAARNCMINKDLLVKVADFGLARDIFENDYYRAKDNQRPLPVKWMAIECLHGNPQFTEKSDVWSYGVLVWELMTRGTKPYSDVDNLDMKRFLGEGRRLAKPSVAPEFIYDLMLRCWLPDPNDRPRFRDIVKELKQILAAAEPSAADQSRFSTMSDGETNVAFVDAAKERASYLQLSVNPEQ